MTHTPGPWHYNPFAPDFIVDNNGAIICERWRAHKERWRADARLIAAAPEVLEALKNILALTEHANYGAFANGVTSQDGRDEGDWHAGNFMDAARAAIAKAEGRQE